PGMAEQIQGEDSLQSFATKLSREVAAVSGPVIEYDRCKLPDLVDQGLMEDFPVLRPEFPFSVPPYHHLKELGRGLGEFLRMAYQDIYRFGAERDWLDPAEFDLLPHGGGYFYGET